jgi:hypothetical protein
MALLFACLTLSRRVQAVTPAPDGGYLDGNTVEGDNRLFGSPAGRDKRPLAIKLKKPTRHLLRRQDNKPPEGSKRSTKGCDLSEVREPSIY